MSKISTAARNMKNAQDLRIDEAVVNYMGGDSYKVSPLLALKMVTASSIFAEPSYYRGGSFAGRRISDAVYRRCDGLPEGLDLLAGHDGKTTTQIMEEAIDAALDHNFGAVLTWAAELRRDYLMRLNPNVIMVRAAMHPKRKEWTEANPGAFGECQKKVMARADEPASQLAYYLYKNEGRKNRMPSILKRSIAEKLSSLDRYAVGKYKNHEIGMINAVRLTHASSPVLDELMRTGTVEADEGQKTWENLRSTGKTWKEILDSDIKIGHMAMLKNLCGIFAEAPETADAVLGRLKSGVLKGKQFPFRYWAACKAVEKSDLPDGIKRKACDALEECIDISLANMPKLKGRTMCLSDNSGSAWGCFASEYGSVTVAEIGNLSSVLAAAASEEGYVGKFGDRLIISPVSKRNGLLSQAKAITSGSDCDVGGSTEGGIWEFFRDAIANKEHYDNLFLFSDMQCGNGCYGTAAHKKEYRGQGYAIGSNINVYALIRDYRAKVNPAVNVFSVQTAGYTDSAVPPLVHRTAILYGWTGREIQYADAMIKLWDEADGRQEPG